MAYSGKKKPVKRTPAQKSPKGYIHPVTGKRISQQEYAWIETQAQEIAELKEANGILSNRLDELMDSKRDTTSLDPVSEIRDVLYKYDDGTQNTILSRLLAQIRQDRETKLLTASNMHLIAATNMDQFKIIAGK